MEFKIRLEQDEDKIWVATCPSFPGCVSQGKTEPEAIKNIKSAIKLHLKFLAEDGVSFGAAKRSKERLIQVHV